MKKIKAYFASVYDELVRKVTWPKWSELQSSAIVVMVASLIFALVIFVMDFAFKGLLEWVYGLFIKPVFFRLELCQKLLRNGMWYAH